MTLEPADFTATEDGDGPLESWSEIDQFGICANYAPRRGAAGDIKRWNGPAPELRRLEWV